MSARIAAANGWPETFNLQTTDAKGDIAALINRQYESQSETLEGKIKPGDEQNDGSGKHPHFHEGVALIREYRSGLNMPSPI